MGSGIFRYPRLKLTNFDIRAIAQLMVQSQGTQARLQFHIHIHFGHEYSEQNQSAPTWIG